MVEAFNLAFDLDDKEVEKGSQNKQLNQRLVSRDEEVQVRWRRRRTRGRRRRRRRMRRCRRDLRRK